MLVEFHQHRKNVQFITQLAWLCAATVPTHSAHPALHNRMRVFIASSCGYGADKPNENIAAKRPGRSIFHVCEQPGRGRGRGSRC